MVSYQYSPLDDPTKTITSVKVGETVRVKVTVIAPAERNYVIIQDLLPAGLKAVDVRLKNVDAALKSTLEAERVQAHQGTSTQLRLWSCARAMMSAKRSACRFGTLV